MSHPLRHMGCKFFLMSKSQAGEELKDFITKIRMAWWTEIGETKDKKKQMTLLEKYIRRFPSAINIASATSMFSNLEKTIQVDNFSQMFMVALSTLDADLKRLEVAQSLLNKGQIDEVDRQIRALKNSPENTSERVKEVEARENRLVQIIQSNNERELSLELQDTATVIEEHLVTMEYNKWLLAASYHLHMFDKVKDLPDFLDKWKTDGSKIVQKIAKNVTENVESTIKEDLLSDFEEAQTMLKRVSSSQYLLNLAQKCGLSTFLDDMNIEQTNLNEGFANSLYSRLREHSLTDLSRIRDNRTEILSLIRQHENTCEMGKSGEIASFKNFVTSVNALKHFQIRVEHCEDSAKNICGYSQKWGVSVNGEITHAARDKDEMFSKYFDVWVKLTDTIEVSANVKPDWWGPNTIFKGAGNFDVYSLANKTSSFKMSDGIYSGGKMDITLYPEEGNFTTFQPLPAK